MILNKEILYKEYIINNLTAKQIALKYGYKQEEIYYQLRVNNIKKNSRLNGGEYEKYDYLYEHYILLNKTAKQIANENNISETTIRDYLKIYNIKKGSNRKIKDQQQIEKIIDMYTNQKMSTREISSILKVNKGAIS